MSRKSPQSISPQRGGSRHSRPESDANIRNFAPVARIMKTALPENAKIAKEAKECMQECVSEFISFITSEGMHAMVVPATTPATTPVSKLTLCSSLRKMPTGETKDGEWRRHLVRHDITGVRELRRSSENLSGQVPRGKLVALALVLFTHTCAPRHLLIRPRTPLNRLTLTCNQDTVHQGGQPTTARQWLRGSCPSCCWK